MKSLGLLLTLCVCIYFVTGKIIREDVDTDSGWIFVSKFCYSDSGAGLANYTIYGDNLDEIQLLLYNDQGSWERVSSHMSCEEKQEQSIGSFPIAKLSGTPDSLVFHDPSRPHFWYFVLCRCSLKIEDIQYTFEFTNPGGYWWKQFSYDKQGFMEMHLVYTSIYLIGLLIYIYLYLRMPDWTINISGSRVSKLYCVIFAIFTLCSVSYYVDDAVYAKNGEGTPGIKGFGEILELTGTLLLLIFMAMVIKGWGFLKDLSIAPLTYIAYGVFFVIYVVFYFWVIVTGVSPEKPDYNYESTPGIILLVFRSLFCVLFVWIFGRGTIKYGLAPEHRRMYFGWMILSSFWILSLPFLVAIGEALPDYNQEKIVLGTYDGITVVTVVIIAVLVKKMPVADIDSYVHTYDEDDEVKVIIVKDEDNGMIMNSKSSPYDTL